MGLFSEGEIIETNRLIFVDKDESASIPKSAARTGFTVIRAPKGTAKPIFIDKGDRTSILNLFGSPSSSYPGIQEAIDFNDNYGLWISAPAGVHTGSINYYDGAYITTLGSVEKFSTPFGAFKTAGIVEGPDGKPIIDYTINTSGSNLGATFSTKTAIVGSPWINGADITVDASTGITIDNLANFDHSKVSTLVVQGNANHGITTFLYTFGYDATGAQGAGWYTQSLNGTLGSVRYGVEAAGTLGDSYTRITFLAPLSDTFCPQLTAANLTTAMAAASPIIGTYSIIWNHDITSNAICALYQSSIRSIPGTLLINSVDVAPISVSLGSATGITFSSPVLTASNIVQFAISSVSGATAGTIIVAGVVVTLTADDITTVNGVASKIASAFTGSWTGSSSTGTVTITSSSSIVNDSRSNINYNTAVIKYTETSYSGGARTIRISTDPNKVDGSSASLYIDDVLGSNQFIRGEANLQFSSMVEAFTPTTVGLAGNRIVSGSTYTVADLASSLQPGWNFASSTDYAAVSLYFDPECCSDIATTMANCRASSNTFATYVTGIKVPNAQTTSDSETTTVVNAIVTKRSTYPNLTGLAYYCNEMYVSETYNGTSYWTIPVGSVCAMLGNIMDRKLGGAAPMFVNEDTMGGQISKSVKKQKYSFNATHLDTLDAAGVNPIILDNYYGLMITSQKTAQSPANLTDWSFLGHSMAFDLFKKEMKTLVMIPQIGKAIDPFHEQLVYDKTMIILNKRLKGAQAIWDSGKVYVTQVNTDETKMQNTFVIKVRIKVNAFSEYVELIFDNISQADVV